MDFECETETIFDSLYKRGENRELQIFCIWINLLSVEQSNKFKKAPFRVETGHEPDSEMV